MPEPKAQDPGNVVTFGPFRLDRAAQELTRDGAAVAIEPQSLRVLEHLIRHRDRVVSRDDLISAIWGGRVVTDWAVSAAIKAVRAALNDDGHPKRYLKTVHARGFRFVGEVDAPDADTDTSYQTPPKSCILVREIRSSGALVEDDYLADGMTDDLITDLTRLTSARTLSRNGSRALADGAKLAAHGVTHVVDGNLRRIGETLRLNLSVQDAKDAHTLWAERFDFAASSLLAAQDQISLRLAGFIDPDRNVHADRRIRTGDPAAYDAYLKGRFAYYRYDPKSFAEALHQFTTATELDPGFAEAFAHQAYCRTALYVFGWPGADKSLDPVEAIARKAVALDDNSALAHARLGWVLGYRGQPDATVAAFDNAVMRDRNNGEVYFAYGETLNRLSQPERALDLLAMAFSKDSFHPPSWEFAKGHARVLLRDFDAAIAHFETVLERVERFIPARVQLARALSEVGRLEDSAGIVASIRTFAPKYDMAAARRMFPYPEKQHRIRLDDALQSAGL